MIYFVLKKYQKSKKMPAVKFICDDYFIIFLFLYFDKIVKKKQEPIFFALCYALSYIIRLLNCLNSGKGNKLRLTHNKTKKVV